MLALGRGASTAQFTKAFILYCMLILKSADLNWDYLLSMYVILLQKHHVLCKTIETWWDRLQVWAQLAFTALSCTSITYIHEHLCTTHWNFSSKFISFDYSVSLWNRMIWISMINAFFSNRFEQTWKTMWCFFLQISAVLLNFLLNFKA